MSELALVHEEVMGGRRRVLCVFSERQAVDVRGK